MKLAPLLVAIAFPLLAPAQSTQSQPTEESKKLHTGSAAERKARMSARAHSQAYTKKFDLSGLPAYVPERQVTGTIRL